MLTAITPSPAQWDAFVAAQPQAHVLQESAWGELKRAYGWRVERVALTEDQADDVVGAQRAAPVLAGAQLLFRPLPFRLGTMAYLGMGPYVTSDDQWEALWRAMDGCARKHGAAFLKWEPGIVPPHPPTPSPTQAERGGENFALDAAKWGFRESPQTVQPPRTILIDISGDEEAILARMNQGTRRKIRQSQKNGIRYYEGTRDDVATFTRLMQTTGERNEFGVHEPGYYQLAYDLFVPRSAALILAEHEGDPLAGIMVFASGKTAWYFYGASSSVKRNLMATYGVQWAAIQWAKKRGCTVYDLWGIPDEDEATLEAQFEKRDDGLWGVYGFKRGWGGQVVRSAGAWDKVYNPVVYAAYRLALNLRTRGVS
jgi:lipid II:glycine glycyltransferase (peptidoglycan interpeptide bridge formation enzyme)